MAIGDQFVFHGGSGVLTLRIEREIETHDGLMLIVGTVLEGIEHYCEEGEVYRASRDVSGGFMGVYVTKTDWARGTNVPAVRSGNRRDRH